MNHNYIKITLPIDEAHKGLKCDMPNCTSKHPASVMVTWVCQNCGLEYNKVDSMLTPYPIDGCLGLPQTERDLCRANDAMAFYIHELLHTHQEGHRHG